MLTVHWWFSKALVLILSRKMLKRVGNTGYICQTISRKQCPMLPMKMAVLVVLQVHAIPCLLEEMVRHLTCDTGLTVTQSKWVSFHKWHWPCSYTCITHKCAAYYAVGCSAHLSILLVLKVFKHACKMCFFNSKKQSSLTNASSVQKHIFLAMQQICVDWIFNNTGVLTQSSTRQNTHVLIVFNKTGTTETNRSPNVTGSVVGKIQNHGSKFYSMFHLHWV